MKVETAKDAMKDAKIRKVQLVSCLYSFAVLCEIFAPFAVSFTIPEVPRPNKHVFTHALLL